MRCARAKGELTAVSASKDPRAVAVVELDVPAAEPDSGGSGWRRNGDKDGGFQYSNARGEPIRGKSHLARIERLAIPPAWTDVRISTTAGADLQATGYDAAGRKQYVYHPDFVARQAERKFKRMRRFFDALPTMRDTTSRHLGAETRPVELRVMATLVRLINECYFRVGSEEYTRRHLTYGVTTLLKSHVRMDDGTLIFSYKGKKGVRQRHVIADEKLLAIVRQLMELPGKRVFQYYDEHDELRAANGHDLNAYIRATMGKGLSAKDFRTWAGTLPAAQILSEIGPAETETQAKRNVVETVKQVAEQLGNTPAVARATYISPVLFEKYMEGKTLEGYTRRAERSIKAQQLDHVPEELALVRLLGLT